MKTLLLLFAALPMFGAITGVTISPMITTQQTTTYTLTTTDDAGAGDMLYTNVFFGSSASYVGTCVLEVYNNPPLTYLQAYDDSFAAWRTAQLGQTVNPPHCSVTFNSLVASGNTVTATFTVQFNSTMPPSGGVWGQAWNKTFTQNWGGANPISIGSIQLGGPTVSIVNSTRPNNAKPTFFMARDTMTITVTGTPGANVTVSRVLNGVQQRGQSIGTIGANGILIYQPDNSDFGHYGMVSDTYSVGGVQCQPSPVNYELVANPQFQIANISAPNNSGFYAVGNSYVMEYTGEALAFLTYSGTVNGVYRNQIPLGGANSYTDPSGNLMGQALLYRTFASDEGGPWNITIFATSNSGYQYVVGAYNFTVTSNYLSASESTASVDTAQDSGIDDTTGNPVPGSSPLNPLPATLTARLRSGETVRIPSAAAGLPLSRFTSGWADEGGQVRYTYHLDNTGVWLWRISDDGEAMNSAKQGRGPNGWASYGAAFGAFRPDAARSADAVYSFISGWRPGLVPVYFQNDFAASGVPHQNDTQDGIAVADKGRILSNAAVRFAIGPAFPPDATRGQVDAMVRHWVTDLGYGLLQPYLDGQDLSSIQPGNDLDKQVIDALRLELDRVH